MHRLLQLLPNFAALLGLDNAFGDGESIVNVFLYFVVSSREELPSPQRIAVFLVIPEASLVILLIEFHGVDRDL